MLGWFIVIIPIVIIVIYTILAIILERNRMAHNRTPYYVSKEFGAFRIFLYKCEPTVFGATVVSIICMIIIAIIMICSHVEIINFVKRYETVTTEYEMRIDKFNEYERAAIFSHAVDLTAKAAVYKFWNNYFDLFIPDSVDKLKPIR